MTIDTKSKPHKIAVIYPYFAHYREPKLHALINESVHHYDFFGDTHSYGLGIKLTEDFPKGRFIKIKGYYFKPFMIQPGALPIALGSKYDTLLLWGNCTWPTMWLAALLGKLRGKKILYFTHGWIRKDPGLKGWFRNAFYKIADGLLVYGHRSKCIGIDFGFDPAKIHVMYNTLDCDYQDAIRAKLKPDDRQKTREKLFGKDSSNPILVNVTRLHHFKKLDMLIDAAAKLNQRGTPTNVLIIGEGPHKPELEQLAKEKGVNAVFTGALYDELEIGLMLNASDLAVMPGPVGLLVMHAFAYGVPVVSNNDYNTQMPEFEAIIPGLTGDFFEAGNLDSLTDTIERVLKSPMTYEERYDKTRESIERFYNPRSQLITIDRAVEGCDANDLYIAGLDRRVSRDGSLS